MERALQTLRIEYLASLPERIRELRADIGDLKAGHRGATDSLKVKLHRLAGSGGSYGFVELSSIAREAERWLADPEQPEVCELEEIIDRLAREVEEAGRTGKTGRTGGLE